MGQPLTVPLLSCTNSAKGFVQVIISNIFKWLMASTTRSFGSFLLSVLWVMALANTSQAASITSAQETFFETEVRPLLADNCFKCHGSKKQEAELRLDALAEILAGGISGPAIQPGQPDKSLLVHVLRHQGKIKMPPDGKLEERQIEALVQWIQSGAPWPGTNHC